MTREAKIGMLTGLGVIVLIGVLLSEYLGDGRGPAIAVASTGGGAGMPTQAMAPLPIGSAYRQQVMDPVGVPGMARADSGSADPNGAVGSVVVPPAFATSDVPAPSNQQMTQVLALGPTVSDPVSAVAAGPSPAEVTNAGAPPTITVQDAHESAGTAVVAKAAVATNQTYVIAAGDTLGKIANKYYGSSKQPDVQRIVAANKSILKDATTTLVVGKKLVIPNAPVATPAAAKTAAPVTVDPPATVYLPGPLEAASDEKPGSPLIEAPKAKKDVTGKTYVVQAGDTPEKIARKYASSNTTEYVTKLMATNGIKDARSLQVGAKLKLPV